MRSNDELRMLHIGATAAELGKMFGMTPQEVNKRIAGKVVPAKTEHKLSYYVIGDAAPHLCNVEFDVEEYLKGLTPAKLPVGLQKAFWAGLRARQDYEENKGDLWRTQRVIEVLAEVFKSISMTMQMLEDTVGQKHELTAQQRQTIIDIADEMRTNARRALVTRFEGYRPAEDEHGVAHEETGTIVIDEDDDGLD